jgi:hypothetical protein
MAPVAINRVEITTKTGSNLLFIKPPPLVGQCSMDGRRVLLVVAEPPTVGRGVKW